MSEETPVSSTLWPEQLLAHLRVCVRENAFDFEKVCASLVEQHPALLGHITADDCRSQFTKDYSVKEPEPAQLAPLPPLPPVVISGNTYDEVLESINEATRVNNERKELIFQRVFASLGLDPNASSASSSSFSSSTSISAASRERRLVNEAYLEGVEKRESIARDQRARQTEAEERAALEKERLALRRRFDPTSEDAQGLSFSLDSSNAKDGGLGGDGAHGGDAGTEDDDAVLESSTNDTTNLFELLDNAQFDALLDQVERDFALQADEKIHEEDTELGEVLRFLEESAKAKATSAAKKVPSSATAGTGGGGGGEGSRTQEDIQRLLEEIMRPTTSSSSSSAYQRKEKERDEEEEEEEKEEEEDEEEEEEEEDPSVVEISRESLPSPAPRVQADEDEAEEEEQEQHLYPPLPPVVTPVIDEKRAEADEILRATTEFVPQSGSLLTSASVNRKKGGGRR